jgi:hypothetical protein
VEPSASALLESLGRSPELALISIEPSLWKEVAEIVSLCS